TEPQTGEGRRRVSEAATSSGARTKRPTTNQAAGPGKRRRFSSHTAIGVQSTTWRSQPLSTEALRQFSCWTTVSRRRTSVVHGKDVQEKQSKSRSQER